MTTTTETVVRFCEYVECLEPLTNPSQRKYCSQAHASAARRTVPEKPAKPKQPNLGLNSSPPPFVPRYEGETWRPNAPGWPAQPRIPVRNS